MHRHLLLFGCIGLALLDGAAKAELSTKQLIESRAVAKADEPSFEATATAEPANKEKVIGGWLATGATLYYLCFTRAGTVSFLAPGMKLPGEAPYTIKGDTIQVLINGEKWPIKIKRVGEKLALQDQEGNIYKPFSFSNLGVVGTRR